MNIPPPRDPTAIRGCLIGMVIAGLIWAAIVVAVLLVLNALRVI